MASQQPPFIPGLPIYDPDFPLPSIELNEQLSTMPSNTAVDSTINEANIISTSSNAQNYSRSTLHKTLARQSYAAMRQRTSVLIGKARTRQYLESQSKSQALLSKTKAATGGGVKKIKLVTPAQKKAKERVAFRLLTKIQRQLEVGYFPKRELTPEDEEYVESVYPEGEDQEMEEADVMRSEVEKGKPKIMLRISPRPVAPVAEPVVTAAIGAIETPVKPVVAAPGEVVAVNSSPTGASEVTC